MHPSIVLVKIMFLWGAHPLGCSHDDNEGNSMCTTAAWPPKDSTSTLCLW